MKTLIVVDMQNDFIDGALGSAEAKLILDKVKEKIELYRKNNHQIIYTRDTHYNDYLDTQEGRKLPIEHCIKDTYGWQIADLLKPTADDIIIDKNTFGYDWSKKIVEDNNFIRGDEIEVIGLCTDICVIANVFMLKTVFPEKLISVDANCCAGVTYGSHKNALSAMKACQVNIIE